MGNYLSFSTVYFENGEIPLSDGEYRGYSVVTKGYDEKILSMVIVHNFIKFHVEVDRLKGFGGSKTVYNNFKIINRTIVARSGIMGQGWTFKVPCRDQESGMLKISQQKLNGEVYFQSS